MSEFSSHETKLKVFRTATVVSSGSLSSKVETVWIVLHGYAQLASEFLVAFEPAADSNVLFIAPEGLSRFYRRPRNTEIGASWMTSVSREDEINDYLAYLDQVFDLILEQQEGRPPMIGILGFSQGASTASRWVASAARESSGRLVDRMILWGGTPAEELRTGSFQNDITPCKVDWITGTEDRFTPPEKFDELFPLMDSAGNPIRMTIFEGKHEIRPDELKRILQQPDA